MRWALVYTAIYVAIAVLIFLVSGNVPFRHNDTTFGKAISLYIAGGLVVGVMLGLLRPFARSQVGATIVGIVIAIPVVLLFRFASFQASWTTEDTFDATFLVLLWGGAGGNAIYRILTRRERKRTHATHGHK